MLGLVLIYLFVLKKDILVGGGAGGEGLLQHGHIGCEWEVGMDGFGIV